jgi:hypothetical protein
MNDSPRPPAITLLQAVNSDGVTPGAQHGEGTLSASVAPFIIHPSSTGENGPKRGHMRPSLLPTSPFFPSFRSYFRPAVACTAAVLPASPHHTSCNNLPSSLSSSSQAQLSPDRRAAAERIGRGVTLVDSASDQVWRWLLLDSIAMEGREGRVPPCCLG